MTEQTRRLFIGLQPPTQAATRLAAQARRLLSGQPDAQVYLPDDLHLTLVYLGPVRDEQVEPLQAALQAEVRGMNAPELSLDGCGAHPTGDQPRSLWAGVVEEGDSRGRLAALRNRALQAALSLGLRQPSQDRRRAFRPHLTLARVCEGASIEDFLGQEWAGAWLPVDVTLFESSGPGAPNRYQPLASYPLVVRPG